MVVDAREFALYDLCGGSFRDHFIEKIGGDGLSVLGAVTAPTGKVSESCIAGLTILGRHCCADKLGDGGRQRSANMDGGWPRDNRSLGDQRTA